LIDQGPASHAARRDAFARQLSPLIGKPAQYFAEFLTKIFKGGILGAK